MALENERGFELYAARITTIASSDPAANTEHSVTVTTGQIWEVTSLQFSLVTDANAANRRVVVTFDDGTTVFAKASAGAAQVASTTIAYTFATGSQSQAALVNTDLQVALPSGLFLPGGYRIKTVTANLQAGDNYGVMTIYGMRHTK